MNILSKFENFELKQKDILSDEDKENCEKMQSIYEHTLLAYKKWYEIYHKSKLQPIQSQNFNDLKLKSLSVCQSIESLHNSFISNIYSYFTKKYSVEIINNYNNENNYDYNYSNSTINTNPLNYKLYVADILKQLNGLDFKGLRINQLKEKIKDICQNRYSKEWRIEIRGNTIKFNDLLYWGYLGMETGKLLTIESALSWFEFGEETKIPEFNQIRNRCHIEWYEIKPCMELSTKKIKSLKFFKNGRMDIKFSSPEIARKFITEWCGYPLNKIA